MAQFKVEGGHRLSGEITPQGAKNEALQILCATLLTPEKVVVHNVPDIVDVVQLIELLAAMGVRVERLSRRSIWTIGAVPITTTAAAVCAVRS